MEFSKKNQIIVDHASADHFEQDLKLFRQHCPTSKLHSRLHLVTEHNKKEFDEHMLMELLDKIHELEVYKNRKNWKEVKKQLENQELAAKLGAEDSEKKAKKAAKLEQAKKDIDNEENSDADAENTDVDITDKDNKDIDPDSNAENKEAKEETNTPDPKKDNVISKEKKK